MNEDIVEGSSQQCCPHAAKDDTRQKDETFAIDHYFEASAPQVEPADDTNVVSQSNGNKKKGDITDNGSFRVKWDLFWPLLH